MTRELVDIACEVLRETDAAFHICDGANAAIAWQRGQIGTVIDYCIQDIRLTKGLFDRALAGTPIRDPKTMREIKLRVPTS